MAKSESPISYEVVFSDLVQQHFRVLAREAFARGDGLAFAAAYQEFKRRLKLYPQFGHPLYDLMAEPGQIYTGIIPPITLRYGVFEDRRLVFCGALPILMPMAKPEPEAEE